MISWQIQEALLSSQVDVDANHRTSAHTGGAFSLCLVFKRGLLKVFRSVSSGVLLLLQFRFSRSLSVDTAVLLGGLLSNIGSALSIGLRGLILQPGNLFLGLGNVLETDGSLSI